ncbi:MAG: PAS domain S-box protein [Ignavibacteriales bacterium]|nr:PAS domain S-box protein [Ignavibacteriales bacterium]
MNKQIINILLVEDNPAEAELLQECLREGEHETYNITHTDRWSDAHKLTNRHNFDIILLDLSLPDTEGIETVKLAINAAPYRPIIALTEINDNGISVQALQAGAEDYLVKGKTDCYMITRSIRYAIERKRVETLLRISEERYRTFFENTEDVFYRTDMRGIIKFISPSVKNYGYTVEEVIEKDVRLFYENPDYREILVETLMKEKSVHDLELVLKRKDNSQVHVSVSAVLIPNTEGKPLFIDGILRDITDRKKSDKALRESEKLLAESQRIARLGSWSFTVANGTLRWSDTMYDIYGVDREKFHLSIESFIYLIHAEDRVLMHQWIDRTMRGEKTGELDFRIILPNGNIRYLRGNGAAIFDANGNPLQVTGTAQDITERKRNEEALHDRERQLAISMSNLPGLAYRCKNDQNWTMEFVSEGSIKLTGYYPEDLINNNKISYGDLIHSEDRQMVWQKVQDAVEKKDSYQIIYRIITAQGNEKWVWEQGRGVFMEDGDLSFLEGFVSDITEQKRAEQELTLRANLLDAANDSIILHDFDGNLIYVNEAACKLRGYTRDEIMKMNLQDLMTEKYRKIFPPRLRELREKGSIRVESAHYRNDKTVIHNEVSARTIELDGKQVVMSIGRDTTAQKKTEEELKISEQQYRDLFFNNPQPMWVYDRVSLSFVAVNEAAIRHYGYSQEEFLSMTLKDIRPAKDVPKLLQNVASIDTPFQTSDSWQHKKKDGTIIDVEITSHSIEWNGRPARIVIADDVTQRKQAEESLRISEESYRTVFENSVLGLYRTLPDGRILMVNPALSKMLGFSSGEEMQQHNLEKNGFHPEYSRSTFKERMEKEGLVIGLESIWIKKDETQIYVRESAKAVRDPSGNILFYEGTVEDITDRIKAESELNKLKQAIEQSPASVIITDLEGKIQYVNTKFTQLTGYTSAEVIGKNPRILKSDEKPSEDYKQLWDTITSGKEWKGEFHNRKKNGEFYWESASISPIKDSTGQITHYLAVKEDITEKKLLELQLLRAQRIESVGTLAGGVAHDLNNVLAPILLSIDFLKKSIPDERSLRMLEAIETSAQRGSAIVKQILGFARGVQGESVLIQFRHIISEISSIIKGTFPKSITIKEEVPKNIWTIIGDPTNLHQVLLNLCVNARDAMPNGGSIFIKAENKFIDEQYTRMSINAKPGRYVLLSVEDNGSGMPPAVLERIFEPFFTTKEIGKGTGLGLSTVHAIVKSHGGFVNVYSEVGKGTTFRIYLPAAKETSETKPKSNDVKEMFLGNGELILVVDDESSIQQITKHTLEANGYHIITGSDGTEAIALFASRKEEIALVLTDMVMPIMDGPSTIKVLRKIKPDVKIIASSGFNPDGTQATSIELGLDAFLTKPYNAQKLLEVIHSVLHKD